MLLLDPANVLYQRRCKLPVDGIIRIGCVEEQKRRFLLSANHVLSNIMQVFFLYFSRCVPWTPLAISDQPLLSFLVKKTTSARSMERLDERGDTRVTAVSTGHPPFLRPLTIFEYRIVIVLAQSLLSLHLLLACQNCGLEVGR